MSWRDAEKRDQEALHEFVCTDPERPRYNPATRQSHHPKQWEYQVQSLIRGTSLPLRTGLRMLLGEDDVGIAWVSVYESVDGLEVVELRCLAISCRHRGQGGGVAKEMATATLDALTQDAIAAGVQAVNIETRVWKDNEPSRRICEEAGLRHMGWSEAPGYLLFGGVLPISGAPFSSS